ncbi:MAG: hypothetical protein COA79_24925 [Planctomycetota bacterium]|nr:MAG: hypothetical protein COA79_24925 [Planctomycetota bacterium]
MSSEESLVTNVVILTNNYRVRGDVSMLSSVRLTDFIVESKGFIAVTNAHILDYDGEAIIETSFLNVNKEVIEMIMPTNEINSNE